MTLTHVPPGDGEAWSVLGESHVLKLRHRAYTLVETTTTPGGGLPPHVHVDQDEAIYVLSGHGRLVSGDDHVDLTAGGFAFVPRGTAHALTALGEESCRWLVVFTPPGAMEQFYDEARAEVGDGALDIARRLGISLLTSPV